MKILVDMNLSPDWVQVFEDNGHSAQHWANVGNPTASDRELLLWAKTHGYIMFTHDLDFGALLAASNAEGPSVIQVRADDITPQDQHEIVLASLQRFSDALESGALISIDPKQSRIRLLPLK